MASHQEATRTIHQFISLVPWMEEEKIAPYWAWPFRFWEEKKAEIQTISKEIPDLPITQFYINLWKTNKHLLFKGIFVNYLLPIVLELLPWWFSRHKLALGIRWTRTKITGSLQTNAKLDPMSLRHFILLSLMSTFLHTFINLWRDKIALEHKFAIRRQVLWKILHSDIEAFDEMHDKTVELFLDVGQSLAFFNYTLPQVFASLYKLFLEVRELWRGRERVDNLVLIYPLVVYCFRVTANWIRWYFKKKLFKGAFGKKKKKERDLKTTEFVVGLIEGLPDIQINNLQQSQLDRLDKTIYDDLSSIRGVASFADRLFKALKKQDTLEFIGESIMIQTVMKRKNIAYMDFMSLQQHMTHTLATTRKIVSLFKVMKKEFKKQKKVKEIVDLPDWQDEAQRTVQVHEFKSLQIRGLSFCYNNSSIPVIDFDSKSEMLFEAGRTYGIVGQNMAGKSTLAHLICKLYDFKCGEMLWNGIPYQHIGRKSLRDMMSYSSQNSFLFPGTIRDNIKIGNPEATEEEVLNAALSAGILAFSTPPSPHVSPRNMRKSASEIGKMIQHQFTSKEFALSLSDDEKEPEERYEDSPMFLSPPRPKRTHNRTSSLKISTLDFSPARLTRSLSMNSLEEMEELHTVIDTKVTGRGLNLSGGLAQSVALARIFVRKQAKVIILDESIGQMDNHKKRSIIFPRLFDFIKKYGMTLIMVSHSMDDIKNLDHIFVMDQGKLVHQGSHQKLMSEQAPAYLELVNEDNIFL